MKFQLISLLALSLLLSACNSEEVFESEFEESLNTWHSEKEKAGNSYRYTIRSISVFGFGSSTVISVRNGKVVSRDYESFQFDYQTREEEITTAWTENENELNTHAEGAKPITLDEIYNRCSSDILTVDKDANHIHFRAENNGLISNCSYVPRNCADDCAIGFNVVNITWL